jgi:hypothetical protein
MRELREGGIHLRQAPLYVVFSFDDLSAMDTTYCGRLRQMDTPLARKPAERGKGTHAKDAKGATARSCSLKR